MKVSQYILIATDGYSIETSKFNSREEAEEAMKKAYEELSPKENEYEDDCWIESHGAYLSANGENVYVWDIQKVEIEVDLRKANEEFVTGFMYNELLENFDFEEDTTDEEIHEVAERAFDIYCEGDGQTEYECIEEAYGEWEEQHKREDMELD